MDAVLDWLFQVFDVISTFPWTKTDREQLRVKIRADKNCISARHRAAKRTH